MANRLTVVDEIFLRTHRGMGTPIALQGLWRTADRVHPELLRQLHSALRVGPLGRRVVRPGVPGARRYWRANDRAYPLVIAPRPLRPEELWEWADAQGFDLDPEFGPGWRLAAARLADKGSLISLTCSHALADGRGLVIAVDQALRGRGGAEVVAPQSDWSDARRQWATVLGGTAKALRSGVPKRPKGSPSVDARRAVGPMPSAVLQIPAADWELTAAARGGTPNSLFVQVVSHMLWDSGFRSPDIAASLPVDTRAESRVDNDMAMTEITVTRADTTASIREKCRAAYEYRMSSPGGLPEEILQVLPDRLAYALSRGAGERDILCSNIGVLPASLSRLGPHRCTGVAARAIHPGLTVLPRTRLSAYLSRTAHTYTLALVSLDPERIDSHAALRDLATATLTAFDLPSAAW
ncbi:hypothetical protein ACWDSJ_08135 [Nocardia sp. NPDC003482]